MESAGRTAHPKQQQGSTIDDDMWEQLTPPTHPTSVERLLVAIETAALAAWFADNEARIPSVMPAPNTRVDPSQTTVSAVKTFAWVSRVLGVEQPAIHVVPDHATVTAATLPSRQPALALGRRALSGWSLPELSFMAAHHLTFSRPGGRLLPFYSDLAQLSRLVRAAVAMCRPELGAGLDPGTLSIPHGFGMLHTNKETGELEQIGVNVNELIAAEHREPLTGIPLHKYICCRVEKL